jgi:hypothetical protein
LLLCLAASGRAQAPDRPAFLLSNDKLELAIARQGGAFIELVLRDDPSRFSPYGAREYRPYGHFLCVDGFGPVSPEERAAGFPGHGEAHLLPWEVTAAGKQGNVNRVKFSVRLPLAQEAFTREITMVDGENVAYVESELTSELAFDRPVQWAEHLTIGSPFLEPVNTVVDMSGTRASTRVHPPRPNPLPRRFASARDFTWPMAPAADGSVIDVRSAPTNPGSIDHATTLMDPARRLAFVTALNTARQCLLGYIFRREEYPWLQDWESYQPNLRMYRGLEFSSQPFDVPRREVIDLRSMFDAPVYRWLPAKSRIGSRFLLFYTRTPAGMSRIDDVRLEGGNIIVEDRKAGKRIVLAASQPL